MEPEEFLRPPEAPVFQPTAEEFKDPVSYISKISPFVSNTGICKIRPPAGWRPPFALNVETFRFVPRLQPLNELEAKSRVKLNFLETLAKFWELQGISFKIPNVDRHPLDLHKLFKIVTSFGGFDEVCRGRKWTAVAKAMAYDNHTVSGSLRTHYEKILYSYEMFMAKNGHLDLKYPPVSPTSSMSSSSGSETKLRRSRRRKMEDPDYEFDIPEDCPEFKKLAFTCPGPKNAFAPLKRSSRQPSLYRRGDYYHTLPPPAAAAAVSTPPPPPTVKQEPSAVQQQQPVVSHHDQQHQQYRSRCCVECGGGYCEDDLLVCARCGAGCHFFCLHPPLPAMPPGKWCCHSCVANECCQPQEAFGFEQGKKEYGLQSFSHMANKFKSQHFNMQPTEVPYSVMEKEFWRLVSSMDDEVVVEYGADLHSSKHGSGFPTLSSCPPGADHYAKSSWNLNNLPNLKGSILRHVDTDISGMKVPWLYVGMCFSCFCWHTEDHWTYSMNYLHWGEPKTWYGVPSAYAEALELAMKEQAPELFEDQPDLMHHLVTTLSPTVLQKKGIPVVRTDQCAGEFVITFPRAYHAGFNQGFNFAEAVNFALPDWLPVGRESVNHYRSVCKSPVFSHDELVCKMAAQCSELDLPVVVVVAEDSMVMVAVEEEIRRGLTTLSSHRELFELCSDDDRQCSVCKTTLFLSGVICTCNTKRLACSRHHGDMCSCPSSNKTLKYRYTLDELHSLTTAVHTKAEVYTTWSQAVDNVLEGFVQPRPVLAQLVKLLHEGEDKGLSCCEQYHELAAAITEAEKAQQTAQGILTGNARSDQLMTVDGLQQFIQSMVSLPCTLTETSALKERLSEVELYQDEVIQELAGPASLTALRDLMDRGHSLAVEIPQQQQLNAAIDQVMWVSEVEDKLATGKQHIDTLRLLYKRGSALTQTKVVEGVVTRVKSLLSSAQEWETKTKAVLKEKAQHPISFFTQLLAKADEVPVVIPLATSLAGMVEQAKEWNTKAQSLQSTDKHPHYNTLKELLSSARPLPMKLEQLPQVESRYSAAKGWVDRSSRVFLKKNSNFGLLETLLPRTPATCSLQQQPSRGGKKKPDDDYSVASSPLSSMNGDRLKEMDLIRKMEKEERDYVCQLRKSNNDKQQRDDQGAAGSPVLYCLCRRPESGYMLQCEVCNEWYHAHCLHIPKSKLNPDKDMGKEMRFICGGCLRSRRPRLDTIVSLLISLQKVPVAISEGTALHCLAERAIAWQKRARELLAKAQGVIDEARGQQLRILDLRKKIWKWRQEVTTADSKQTAPVQSQLAIQADSVLRHYQAQLQKEKQTYGGLTESLRRELENQLLDGDLLEVTTDETTSLWQTLQTDTECQNYFKMSESEAAKCAMPKIIGPRKSPVVLEEGDPEASSPAIMTRKRKRSETPSSTVSNKSSEVAADSTSPVKKKRPSKRKPAPSSGPVTSPRSSCSPSNDSLGCNEQIPQEEDEGGEEGFSDDAVCSATQCIRPMANEISWVQCDQCQQWFHLLCVGLTTESVQKIDSYSCFPCRHVPTPPPPPRPNPLAAAS